MEAPIIKYLEGRCDLCGGIRYDPGTSAWQEVATRCTCLPTSYDHVRRKYDLVSIRPEQYQEIIDRLELLETLIGRLRWPTRQ